MTYRVTCTRMTGDKACAYMSEWHTSLAAALDALADHQQRAWDLVALVPHDGASLEPRDPWEHLPLFRRQG